MMLYEVLTLIAVLAVVNSEQCLQLYAYDKKAVSPNIHTPVHREKTLNGFECGKMLSLSKQWLAATYSEMNGCKIYDNVVAEKGELQDQGDSSYMFHHASGCWQLKEFGFTTSGVYDILLAGENALTTVYCDMETDKGGWTVFQRRKDGTVDFYLNWQSYSEGFGNLMGEFWLGNNIVHRLTNSTPHELRVDLEDFNGNKAYAKYDTFFVGTAHEEYKLNVSGYVGSAGNSMGYHNGMNFTTKDNDNDCKIERNCASEWIGAWWYNDCTMAHLNGRWGNAMMYTYWRTWKDYTGLRFSRMMIRPRK